MRWTTVFLFALSACSARGGYAEPGPMSPNAMPPPNSSVMSGSPLQSSPAQGRGSEIPPAVGPGGNQINPMPDGLTLPPECSTDLDCVPATCCHPRACVLRARAPRCDEVMCTQSCEPDTLDCGGGSCGCVRGFCQARMRP
jgi:hypothetical protein